MARSNKQQTEENKKKLIIALNKSIGVIAPAIESVPISRATYNNWYNEDIKFREQVDEIYEKRKDMFEQQLMKLGLKDASERSIMFFLKTQAADRGYADQQAITNKAVQQMFLQFISYVLQRDIQLGQALAQMQIDFIDTLEQKEIKKIGQRKNKED
jgi:hypothetical protein